MPAYRSSAYTAWRPFLTGVSAVFAVVSVGVALGYALGFDVPTQAYAQIAPTVAPVTVTPILPPPPPPPPVIAPPMITPVIVSPVIVSPPSDTHVPPTPATSDPSTNTVSPLTVVAPVTDNPSTPGCCDTTGPTTVTPLTVVAPITDNPITPGCCTTPQPPTPLVPPIVLPPPVIPPPVVPPVVVPPVIPPSPTAVCVSFTASATNINPGDAVTLTWTTENASNISIDNGVGNVTPVAHGSVVVHPTSDTTYTATVGGVGTPVHCQAPVHVVTPGGGSSPACLILEAAPTVINPGDAVTLRYGTLNATSASIDQGVGVLNPPTAGTVVVHPTAATTYTLTVPGAPTNSACQASVTLSATTTPPGGGGTTTPPTGGGGGCSSGCGGGGGGGSPNVLLTATPQPLASVYLSQIPYTGLDLGPLGTVLYWLTLVLWSGAAAYLILFGAMPMALKKAQIFGSSVQAVLNASAPAASVAAAAPQPAQAATVTSPPPIAPSQPMQRAATAPAPQPVRLSPSREGFRAFASSTGALTIEDIVKGLSRESGMVFEQSAQPASNVPEYTPATQPVAQPDLAPGTPTPSDVPAEEAMPARAPLDAPERSAAQPADYPQEVPAFVATLLAGDRDALFAQLRAVARSGADTQEFLAQAVCALDDAYRAHVEGTPVHPEIARLTSGCHPAFLEKLVGALATAVDSSYSSGITGTKLALTRALALVNG